MVDGSSFSLVFSRALGKAVTAVEIKGRIGPGGVEGVLVTFERPRG